jgi:cell shape-determining protein MreD
MNLLPIINLFFVPVISLYLYRRHTHGENKFSYQCLSQYMIFTVLDLLLTHCLTALVKVLLGFEILDTSTYYLLPAIPAAVLTALFVEVLKEKGQVKIKVTDKKEA